MLSHSTYKITIIIYYLNNVELVNIYFIIIVNIKNKSGQYLHVAMLLTIVTF